MTRKTTTTAKNNRKPKKNKQPSLTKLRNAWKKANTPKRILIVGETLIASIVALALIVGLVRFVGWRVQVDEAVASQEQLQTQYDFNPGNIISDGLFFNGNALSEQQVNAIIENRCRMQRREMLESMTFSTESQPANEYCEAYEGEPNEKRRGDHLQVGKGVRHQSKSAAHRAAKGAASAYRHRSKRLPIQVGHGIELPGRREL